MVWITTGLLIGGSFIENAGGTAIFTGSFVNNDNADLSFDFNVVFSGKTYAPPAGSPKEVGGPCSADVDNSDWYYYTSTDGTLIGTGDLAGAVVTISRHGPSFQVGTGANENNMFVFGASGWLDFEIISNPSSGPAFNAGSEHFDFNFELPNGPQLIDIPSCLTICAGGSVDLFATALPVSGSYTYLWSTGETTASISVSPASTTTYSVVVTDLATNCTTTSEVTVTVNDPPQVTCTVVDGDCSNNNLGSVSVADVATWTYEWVNDADPGTVISTTASATGLVPGSYTVTVTDTETGCTASCSSTVVDVPCCNVTDPGEIGGGDVACGSIDGPITISSVADPSGGLGDLEIVWIKSNIPSPNTIGNPDWSLVPGANELSLTIPGPITQNTYYIRCARRAGCTSFVTGESNRIDFIVNAPPVVICSSENGSCGGLGSASVDVTSGTAPYTYSWTNEGGDEVSTEATASGLADGVYTVLVTDANGCTNTCSETIANTPAVEITCSSENGSCGELGSASVDVTSGTAPFTYSWTNEGGDVVSTDASASDLADGVYTVLVTDANGCSNTCFETIANTPGVEITCSSENGSCGGLGSASVDVTSGTAPFTYSWTNEGGDVVSTDASASDLADGVYTVLVTDANGCTNTCFETIANTPAVEITCSSENGACGEARFRFSGCNNWYSSITPIHGPMKVETKCLQMLLPLILLMECIQS